MGATVGSGLGSIWLASTRDLEWRMRRFLVAAIATGLVFGVALMMSGIANSFSVEVYDTVAALGAHTWLVPMGSPGPFTDTAAFPIDKVAELQGVRGVSPGPVLIKSAHQDSSRASSSSTTEGSSLTKRGVGGASGVPARSGTDDQRAAPS